MKKVNIIAEIGVNYYDIATKYNMSLEQAAKLMIIEAKNAGATAVKFQSYKADKIAAKDSPSYWDTTEEPTTNQRELFQKFDKFGAEEYRILADFCKAFDIEFMSTPFDLEAVEYLNELVTIHKISSSDLTNTPLLKKVASSGKPIVLSTGASTMEEVKQAVSTLEEAGAEKIILMHCILNYPTLNNNANLGMINDLKTLGYELGYSDHTLPDDRMLILTTAVNLGCTWIEKHFTLDKTLQGNDHYHAMDPKDLEKFSENLELLGQVMGSDKKTYLPSEEISRLNARRSWVTNGPVKAGTLITEDNIIAKRPATGISTVENILGKTFTKDLPDDHILHQEDIK